MENIVNMMQDIGFSINEAKVYLALVIKNPMSGYEIAKNTDITRTMIYDILKRLVQKGAVIEIEANPKLYSPVSYKELFNRYREDYLKKISELEEKMDNIKSDSKVDSYLINITDYEYMIKEIKHLIREAKNDIYLSIWEQEALIFMNDLQEAHNRGVNIISFSYGQLPYDFGVIYQYGIPKDVLKEIWTRRRIIVVADRERILIGEGNETIEEISVITSNTMLIELAIDQLILDIIQLRILKNEGVLPDTILKKSDYINNIIEFHKKIGIDYSKIPRRVEED
ncbi:MAG: TrmB family transcriptional regulator [Firmicutes bacterium]|nr:TrmB family transcriptional regulator [Bacillota bacterium]